MEEKQAKVRQVQRKDLHYGRIHVRVLASFLWLEGILALISTIVSLVSNPSLILSIDFLPLNMSIFLFLLVWGLWTFKRWAYEEFVHVLTHHETESVVCYFPAFREYEQNVWFKVGKSRYYNQWEKAIQLCQAYRG